MVQWLRIRAPNVGGMGLIPGQGSSPTACHGAWPKKKKIEQGKETNSPLEPLEGTNLD